MKPDQLSVSDLGFSYRLSPDDFAGIVDARAYAWNLDITDISGAGVAAVCAMLYGGELVVDDPETTLKRIRLKDVVIEPRSLWIFIHPPDCTSAFPVTFGPDTATWVMHYLVMWASRCDSSPNSRPFACIDIQSVVEVARNQALHGNRIDLRTIVAANRNYLRTQRGYPPETVGFLSATWRKLKVACPCPPNPKRSQATSDNRFGLLNEFQAKMSSIPRGQKPSRIHLRRWLDDKARTLLADKNSEQSGANQLEASIRALGEILAMHRLPEGHASDNVNELLGLLLLSEKLKSKRNYAASSLATYVSGLKSCLAAAECVPFWCAVEPLLKQQGGRASVLAKAAQATYRRYFWWQPGLAPTSLPRRDQMKVVEYVPLELEPLDDVIQRIEETGWPLDERRSLQWQVILGALIRRSAVANAGREMFGGKRSLGGLTGAHFEFFVEHEKFGHPGGRVIEPVSGDLWEELVRWLNNLGWVDMRGEIPVSEGRIIEPRRRGERFELAKRLRQLGFAPGITVHTMRTLHASWVYLHGTPLLSLAREFYHEHPKTLEHYVASRHLRQRMYALDMPRTTLPRQLQCRLSGTGWRSLCSDQTGLPIAAGLTALPFECFRPLSVLARTDGQDS